MNQILPFTRSTRAGRRATLAAVALLAPLALVACGSDDEPTAGTAATAETETAATAEGEALPPAGEGGELVIESLAFSALTTTAGAEIAISNRDGFAHTVTADDGSFSVGIDGGATQTLVIDAAGTYAIHCNIHPAMTGTIVVE